MRTQAVRVVTKWDKRAKRILTLALAPMVVILACTRLDSISNVRIPADSAAGELQFQLSPRASAILVPAYINGRGPVSLILDTGSTLTCVDDSLAREFNLPRRLGAIGVGAGVGMSGPVKLLRVDSLRVGAASVSNITVCSVDLAALQNVSPGARGLLGLNFLKSFRMNLDFKRRVLQLTRP